jgi:predicted metal-dependent phosphoesterase TrpH
MLIDLHAHSSGISPCCRIAADEVVRHAAKAGLDGIVLTNHYCKDYLQNNDSLAFAHAYLEEYDYAKACGDAQGIRVFFGIEITMQRYDVHLLVYGVDADFILTHHAMYDYTQQDLYHAVHEYGGLLVQAHPYRGGTDRLLDTTYLDGVELSCHPLYDGTHLSELSAIAQRDSLILTCGGDYHADTHRPHCGLYLPDDILTGKAMAAYLRTTPTIRLCVQEVGDTTWTDILFERSHHEKNPHRALT